MIKLADVCFSYKTEQIISGLNLEINKGEFLGVIGINGSGKSTLLRILSRLVRYKSGSITLDGKSYDSFSRREFAKYVSFLPQTRNVPQMSAYDFVASGRYPYLDFTGKLKSIDIQKIENAIEMSELSGLSKKNLSELSGGERQRAYIAMALAQDTPYIFLDEPTSFLDVSHRLELMKLLCNLRNSGKGVVAAIHDISLTGACCDKVLILEKGRPSLKVTPEEVFGNGYIDEAFNVKSYCFEICGKKEYILKNKQ